MAENPLLLKGFTDGWLQKFFTEPFDPLCVMLAMRSKLLLDAIDEQGKSYNLLRQIGYGWIDLGPLPGEEPDPPDDYIPPPIIPPIVVPPEPPPPVWYPPPTPTPTPTPAPTPAPSPAPTPTPTPTPAPRPTPTLTPIIPTTITPTQAPTPGEPGYGKPMPGTVGYVPPPTTPLPIAVAEKPAAGKVSKAGGKAAISKGMAGHLGGDSYGNPYQSMNAAWGFGFLSDVGGHSVGGFSWGGALSCCLDKDDPSVYVHIGWDGLPVACDETKELSVVGYDPLCTEDTYEWAVMSVGGSVSPISGYTSVFTAPSGSAECDPSQIVVLYCNGDQVDSITIEIDGCPVTASIGYTTRQMQASGTQTLTVVPGAAGCGVPEYTWAITAGGGSISGSPGSEVIYTAPATNAECANNPTIQLSCDGVVVDTLSMAVNVVQTACALGTRKMCVRDRYPTSPRWICCKSSYNCIGVQRANTCGTTLPAGCCTAGCESTCTEKEGSLTANSTYAPTLTACNEQVDGYKDERTGTLITQGCCPEQVL